MTDYEISEELTESKRLTIENQKEYHCIECGRLCRVFVFNEPKSCLFDVYKKTFWTKTDKPRWKPEEGGVTSSLATMVW